MHDIYLKNEFLIYLDLTATPHKLRNLRRAWEVFLSGV